MMPDIDPRDKYPGYQPEPEYIECDGCGNEYLKDSLHRENEQLICDECLREDADQESDRLNGRDIGWDFGGGIDYDYRI